MTKIKWIKVGDVIEVDGKKEKLKSIGEDFRYATLYTFKREDGSKFYWGHREVYEYVMDRHIRKLENLLSDEKQRADELEDVTKRYHDEALREIKRADELEKRWEKLKEHFIKEKEQSFGMLSWSRNNGVLELIERLEEDDNA